MSETTGAAPGATTLAPLSRRLPYLAGFALASFVVATIGIVVYRKYDERIRAQTEALLLSLASSRATAVSDRLRERFGDATVLARQPEVVSLLRTGGGTAGVPSSLRAQLTTTMEIYGYRNIILIDRALRPLYATNAWSAHEADTKALALARSSGRRQVIVVHRTDDSIAELGVVVPVIERASAEAKASDTNAADTNAPDTSASDTTPPRAIGYLVATVEFTSSFFPVLLNTANGNPSFDMVMAQREGDSVVVISSSNFAARLSPLSVRRPLSDSVLAARGLMSVRPDTMAGVDYRGVPVLGAVVRVAESPWVVVAKIDLADVEDDIHNVGYAATLVVVLMIIAMGFFVRAQLLARDKLLTFRVNAAAARTLQVVQTSTDGFVVLDDEGRFVEANAAIARLTGYSDDEFLRLGLSDMRVVADQESIRTALTAIRERGAYQFMSHWRRKDGRMIDIEVSATYIADETPGSGRVYAFVRDVTERLAVMHHLEALNHMHAFLNHANQALIGARSEQEAFDLLCQAAVDEGRFALAWVGMVDTAADRVRPVSAYGAAAAYARQAVITLDPAKTTSHGPTANSIRGSTPTIVNDYLTNLLTEPWHELAREYGFGSAATFPLEVEGRTDGAIMFYSPTVGYFEPELVALLGEITRILRLALQSIRREQMRQREVARRQESEARFRELFEAAPVAMFVVEERTGRLTQLNIPFIDLFGYTRDDIDTLTRATELFYPDPMYRAGIQEAFNRDMKSLSPDNVTIRSEVVTVRCKDGSDRDVQEFVTRIGGELVVAWVDLTELRRSQSELLEAQRIARMASWSYDFQTEQVARSEELVRMYDERLTPVALEPKALDSLFHPDDGTLVREELLRGAREHTACEVTARAVMPDGSIKHFHNRAKIEYDEEDCPLRAIGTTQDVTAEVEAALELERYRTHLEELVAQRTAELEAAYEKVRSSELRYAYAMEASSEGIWDWDLRTDQVEASASVFTMLGYAPNEFELTGPTILEMRHPDDRESVQRITLEAIRGVGAFTQEYRVRAKDGSYRWILSHGKVVERDAEGRALRLVGTYTDLSARKAAEQELRAAKEAADEANRAKSSFLAVMSHEIRTPMNGVLGMAEVLTQSALAPREADAVRTIRTSAMNLLGLIDDILDFSKIEAGRLELETTDLDLGEVLEGVVSSLAPVASTRHVELSLFVHPDVPTMVRCDATRLRQILYNLAGNAIKFSGGRSESLGRVRIRVERVGAGSAPDAPLDLRFTVADNGIGMSEETLSRLFTSFMQGEASTTRRFGGTGLGLAICRRLTDMFGGKIEVTSTLGVGSTFTVTLPLAMAAVQPPRPLPEIAGVRCYLVRDRDEQFEADDFAIYLRRGGAEATIVASVQEALAATRGTTERVVIIDRMHRDDPRTDSAEQNPQVVRLRIGSGRRRVARVVSGTLVTQDRQFLRERSLLRAVAIAAGRASPETFMEEREAPLVTEGIEAPTVAEAREQGTLILVAEDDDVNQRVIMRQLELLGYAAEVAVDGEEALRMWRFGQYAMLLTDLHMPKMDGYTLARTVRNEEPADRHRPVVALTANALRGEEARAFAHGMDAYLTKPVSLKDLKQVLDRWVPLRGMLPPDDDSPAPATLPILDLGVLRSLIGDDAAIVRKFLGDYEASAVRLSGEIGRAYAERNFGGLSAAVHRLKSSSRSVGALRFGELCAEIESAARRNDEPDIARAMDGFDGQFRAVLDAVHDVLTS
jgi:PAS domain S-box-containing protein